MAKRTLVSEYDQFTVRMPPGLRDRIKAKAGRAGMSMNEAIVWVLEINFPPPATLEDRVAELARAVAQLKNGNELEPAIDAIVDDIDATLRDVAYGKIGATKSFKDRVSSIVEEWDRHESDIAQMDPFNDANFPDSNVPPVDDNANEKSRF